MPCFHPLSGWYSRSKTKLGKRSIVFQLSRGLADMPVKVPCGRCVGCRLERSRQWALRCYHESQLYPQNCFITLTFDNEHLNVDGSLVKRDYVLFMKRLRKMYGADIRFFHCGEYGSLLNRPHHHACLFNFDFPDKKFYKLSNGVPLYRSASLEKLWPYGFCTIGSVTFESAAYVARYIMKKINGEDSDIAYANEDGVVREKEYITMSRRPGIAHDWFEKYGNQIYDTDCVTLRGGVKSKPPRYYDTIYDLTNPKDFAKVKRARVDRALELSHDNGPDRLLVKEKVATARLGQLKRSYEND